MIFNKINIALTVIASIFLFSSCDNILDPGQSKIKNSIIFNLTANAKTQKLFLYDVIGLDDEIIVFGPLQDYNKYFTENALITLETNDTSFSDFIMTRDTNNVKFYTNENLNPKSGEVYNLEIKVGDNIITGKTMVPDDFQIIAPKENQIFPYSNSLFGFKVELKWESKANIYGYILNVSYPLKEAESLSGFMHYNKIIFDTGYNFIGQSFPTDTVVIKILGFDKNYYEHVFKGKESSGIEGAYGYFGSSVLKTVKVIVR